jgi:MinD superfamily P-loop ATPase
VKQLVVLSGKGGTGKTTVAAALADLASQQGRIVLADADVDASNLELLLSAQEQERRAFFSSKVAAIDPEKCELCGLCQELCRFDAVVSAPGGSEAFMIDPLACEGCAVCYLQCPAEAIRMEEPQNGLWFLSDTRFGPLVHAHLFAGQENSGKLVAEVRQRASAIARDSGQAYIIIDGPPGIGCPVIAATVGTDLALIVTEPTVAGTHDLERILGVVAHFGVPGLVCINKYDINLNKSREIEDFCGPLGIDVIGHIPFDTAVTEAMVQGQPITSYENGAVTQELRRLWRALQESLAEG